jgi:heme-degrading monooxygenase HmoA
MIKRIVRMVFLPESEELFMKIFNEVKHEIRSQPGCLGFELLRSIDHGEINLWTISLWQSTDDLETYRTSALFRKTWSGVKPLFSAKALAWTLTSIEELP